MKNYQNERILHRLHDSCPKNYQNTQIFMIFARKTNTIPEFYIIFAPKLPEFYITIVRKMLSGFFFFWGGGECSPCPFSYAYDYISAMCCWFASSCRQNLYRSDGEFGDIECRIAAVSRTLQSH